MIARSLLLVAVATSSIASQAAEPVCAISPGLAVDADGAPNSYMVDGSGLSRTCDGVFAIVNGVPQTQKNNKEKWEGLCLNAWALARASNDYSHVKIVGFLTGAGNKPLVQAAGDPLPGRAFVTKTMLSIPGTPGLAQRHFVNALEIPYFVAGGTIAGRHVVPGDVVAVYRPKTHALAFAVYGDCCTLGEGSVRLHRDLGNDPIRSDHAGVQRAKAGIGDRIVFVPLPTAHTTATPDAATWREAIKRKGDASLKILGGVAAVERCWKVHGGQ